MSIEHKVNYQLNKYPGIKKLIKRGYQRTMYALSKKVEGVCVTKQVSKT